MEYKIIEESKYYVIIEAYGIHMLNITDGDQLIDDGYEYVTSERRGDYMIIVCKKVAK